MDAIPYFAYGSNMFSARLLARLPAARRLDGARLDGYRLAFHKVSDVDGSGKCDVVADDDRFVHGVVWRLHIADAARLDAVEGPGYRRRWLDVEVATGKVITALTYVATVTDPALKPFDWYWRHVRAGAVEAGVSPAYLAMLDAVERIPDPDPRRAANELALHDLDTAGGDFD